MEVATGRRNIFSLIIKAYCAASGPMYVRGRHASLSGPLRDFKVHEILREADYLQRVAFHENDRNPEMEIEECLDGDIADLDLIDLIWERYGL